MGAGSTNAFCLIGLAGRAVAARLAEIRRVSGEFVSVGQQIHFHGYQPAAGRKRPIIIGHREKRWVSVRWVELIVLVIGDHAKLVDRFYDRILVESIAYKHLVALVQDGFGINEVSVVSLTGQVDI